MTSEGEGSKGSDWRRFAKRHWGALVVFAAACVLAFASVVYVFLWFVANAQSTALVPSGLALWTMNNLVRFVLYAIFWELLIVGIPVVIGALIGWQWWRRLPYDERTSYHFSGRGSRTSGGSGGVSLIFFIAFCIKVYLDGNWNAPIASWSLDYVVNSMVLILMWFAIIFGIPSAIALTWWIRREMSKP